jgi:hypothetical protein
MDGKQGSQASLLAHGGATIVEREWDWDRCLPDLGYLEVGEGVVLAVVAAAVAVASVVVVVVIVVVVVVVVL